VLINSLFFATSFQSFIYSYAPYSEAAANIASHIFHQVFFEYLKAILPIVVNHFAASTIGM
jgi:hypothetical protein